MSGLSRGMAKGTTGAVLAMAGLALGACGEDSQAQQEVRQQAEAIEDSYEAEAEIVEALAAGAPEAEQQAAEAQADTLRETGQEIEDHLKEEAKEL